MRTRSYQIITDLSIREAIDSVFCCGSRTAIEAVINLISALPVGRDVASRPTPPSLLRTDRSVGLAAIAAWVQEQSLDKIFGGLRLADGLLARTNRLARIVHYSKRHIGRFQSLRKDKID